MGYLRKALSISTLGLSNLVLEDDSKPPVTKPTKGSSTRKRAKAKPKARARAKTVASASAGERKTARAKPRPAGAKAKTTGAKAKPIRAKAKPARTTAKAASRTRTTAARTSGARTTTIKPARARRAKPLVAQQPKAQAAPRAQAAPTAQPAQAPTAVAAEGAPMAVRPGSGVAIALDRISKLHKHGALSDREFAAAKARILGTSSPTGAPEPASATFPAIEANVAAARRLDGYVSPDREAATTRPGAPGSGF